MDNAPSEHVSLKDAKPVNVLGIPLKFQPGIRPDMVGLVSRNQIIVLVNVGTPGSPVAKKRCRSCDNEPQPS